MTEIEIIHDQLGLVVVSKPARRAVHNGKSNLIDILSYDRVTDNIDNCFEVENLD